jgi:hypothetical protein
VEDEKELLRVSIVNETGLLLFDSVIQPSKKLKYVPLFNLYLFDPSFGIPLKYLNEMLNNIFNKRIIIGHDLPQLIEILKIKQSNVVYTIRDLKELPELRNKKSSEIAS